MSSLVFTSINVHIPPLLERRADLRRCIDASEGRCVFGGSPAEWQYIHLGTVHGVWLSALLGCAVQTVLPG
jgi:hypothetical protein